MSKSVSRKISYRQYRKGDEEKINNLYFQVTGRRRSIDQFRWQWLDAPGGQGEIWLIEYENSNGDLLLVGHHGVMPLRFSAGNVNLMFGKTENTMVLPEYRKKILYTRFEQRFLKQYEPRFNATFSTMGPSAAIRLREALGYTAENYWITYDWPLRVGATLDLLAAKVGRNTASSGCKSFTILANTISKIFHKIPKKTQCYPVPLVELTQDQALNSPFFDTFWDNARLGYSITPRRDKIDLNWRFWSNPYAGYVTLISDRSPYGDAYAILKQVDVNIYQLDDFICFPNTKNHKNAMLFSVCNWVCDSGGSILRFVTTSDSTDHVADDTGLSNLNEKLPFSLRKTQKCYMPRRLNKHAENYEFIRDIPWDVNPFVFEGR